MRRANKFLYFIIITQFCITVFFCIIVTYNCKVPCDANYLMLWRFYDRLSTLERVQEHSQACDLVNLSISHSLRTLCIPEVFEPSYLRGFDWMDASITYSEYASLQRPSLGRLFPRYDRSQIDPSTLRESRILTQKILHRAAIGSLGNQNGHHALRV